MRAVETALTRLLDIQYPILTAPMSGVVGGALASAVSQAGGIGIVAPGPDEAVVRRELAAVGNARVGVGFIAWRLERNPAALDVALESRPVAVMLSFGDSTHYFPRIRSAGCKIIFQAQTVAMAKEAADAGADIIIAQGRDAGGHGGAARGTFGLIPAVVDAVAPIPVVAAGGIADGRGLAAALMLGAAGVSMGTRFVATREALYSAPRKAELVAGLGDRTEQSRLFDTLNDPDWPRHFPARYLRNKTSERWEGKAEALEAIAEEERARYAALPAEDFTERLVLAGEGVDLIADIPSAREVVERIVTQAAQVMRGGAASVRD
jgi:nitronate monooxygenase